MQGYRPVLLVQADHARLQLRCIVTAEMADLLPFNHTDTAFGRTGCPARPPG